MQALRAIGLAGVLASAPAAAAPDDLVARPLVLDAGQVAAQLVVESSLASKQVLAPLSLAPDAWWGATARWTLGIVHSDASLDRVDFGASACVRTTPGACPRVYHGGGLDARYLAWAAGSFAVAPRARLIVREVGPWKPAATLGALARWQRGRFAVTADPYLQLGLANTDRGNRSALLVPVYFAVQPTCRWALALETGYVSELVVWRDGYHVPVALSVTARATAHVDLGAQAGFTSLLGPQNNIQQREMWLTLAWRR